MKCSKPKCSNPAAWTPVVVLPTVRDNSVGEPVKTDKPTLIVMVVVCHSHRNNYTLSDWINKKDWREVIEEAKRRGFTIPELELISVLFRPIGWTPNPHWLEMERS